MRYARQIASIVFTMVVLLSINMVTVNASGPNDGEFAQLAYLDNNVHTIGPNASQLFRFDYALKDDGSRPMVSIRMPNGGNGGVSFEIWSADQLRAERALAIDGATSQLDRNVIGRGTAANVNCDTGAISASGLCKAADLTWAGALGATGPYFVGITNNTAFDQSYQLTIQGSGVRLAPQTQVAAAAPLSAPAAAPQLAASGSGPDQPATLDAQKHTVSGGKSIWYRFDYALNSDGTRPLVTMRLLNGTQSGIGFRIWTPDQLHMMAVTAADALVDKTHNQPIGMGTAMRVNCDTGQQDGSALCQAPDLIWKGTFGATGQYYVEVVNTNAADGSYQLVVTTE